MGKMGEEDKLRYRWLRPFGVAVVLLIASWAAITAGNTNTGLQWLMLIVTLGLLGYALVRRSLDRRKLKERGVD